MEAEIKAGSQKRNLTGSLEQCKEELRDAYMNFKDLYSKCVVDVTPGEEIDQNDSLKVYYFKPETFLVDDPEKQRQYRENMLKKISQVPKPDPINYLGDDLHRSMCQTIADRSKPQLMKVQLCEFFKRRQYSLQHMKYKLLCRWAHHNMSSETIENISTEATFIYGKLEFNIEQSVLRNERLEQEDFYDSANKDNRPSTKTENEGRSLYVEKFDLDPQSLIREDDIEVYIRGVAHRNKINRMFNKYISRLKWLPMLKKQEIFESSISDYFNLKNANINRQNQIHDKVKESMIRSQILTNEQKTDLEQTLKQYYCKQYEKMFIYGNERTLYSWKANHDEVPRLIGDFQLLKLKIVEMAEKHNITGDINLDNGYSFSYQVTVFFPNYFQKQLLKSQFSIYDMDQGTQQDKKLTLSNANRIDTNIFRDVSTIKSSVPNDEAIQTEIKSTDIKIIRLKTSAFWICYVALSPTEPEWHTKQKALLNCENPKDSLLQQGFNFIDINDLASINRIMEDNSHTHIQNIQKLKENNPNDLIETKTIQTQDGERRVAMDQMPVKSSHNEMANIEVHLLYPLMDQDEKPKQKQQKSLNQLSQHLLTSFYTLRFINSRDAKIRLLYTLNYFRTIQKRFALDLREFATRDRMEAHQTNSLIHTREANQQVINQANFSAKAYEQIQKQKQSDNKDKKIIRNMTVFDDKLLKEMKNMATLKMYKSNGLFSNRVFDTCPSYPKYHAVHGEPVERMTLDEEFDRKTQFKSVSEQSIRLMGRIEFIEINEHLKEVYVKDDFGVYIIHDCVFQDMKCLEDELIKICSLFIHKSELLQDPAVRPIPLRDRLEITDDILQKESQFSFEKVKLCQVYMECYEHVTDPLEQQRLMQIITDIMARRPRLNLNANYFVDAYDAEINCLQKQFSVVKMLVDMQISLEKAENKRLQDSLALSYHLANQYSQNKWMYQDAEALIKAIEKTKKIKRSTQAATIPEEFISSKSQSLKDSLNEKDEDNFGEEDSEHKFAQLLGLPQITLESIYQSYREKDPNVLKIMQEHSHFIQIHEGYPEFLTRLTHRSITDKNKMFKVNPWSQETGSLDFYETLDFINKFYAVTQSIQNELHDSFKMWDITLMTFIDTQVAEVQLKEFQTVQKILEGAINEYEGRSLVEDEQILGNSDKMIFYAKEMLSSLSKDPKHLLDPFVIAKLDLETIKYFKFPKIDKNENKYTLRQQNKIQGSEYLIKSEKNFIAGLAKYKTQDSDYTEVMQDLLHGKVSDAMNGRNICVPSQLKLYCNMVELHRLRSEIILAVSECTILQTIYLSQCEFINQKNNKVLIEQAITFDALEFMDSDQNLVDFLEEGPSHKDQINLAAKEFESALLSNCNFRNPDSFKLNILTSGLEEIRAVLQYQLMQKHILIVATRINSILIEPYQRVISELNLVQKKIALPNSFISYSTILVQNQEIYNLTNVKNERIKIKTNLSSFCAPHFYKILDKKSQYRNTVAKEFSNYQTLVIQAMPHDDYCIRRLTRCFKVKLLTKLVQNILIDVYLDAQKVQSLQSCQRLRKFGRYFMFQPSKLQLKDQPIVLFNYENIPIMENYCINYMPEGIGESKEDEFKAKKDQQPVKVINDGEIINYFGIPSSASLMKLETSSQEDIKKIKFRKLNIRFKQFGIPHDKEDVKNIDVNQFNPEIELKQMLPSFTPIQMDAQKKITENTTKNEFISNYALDYVEGLHFGDTQFARLTSYYAHLERIMSIEWCINKLQFRSDAVIHIDHAIDCGLPFWHPDEFDQRVNRQNLLQKPADTQMNKYSLEFFYDQIVAKQQKHSMAEVVQNFSQTIKSFINQYQKTKPELRNQYITQYAEFRYQQIIGSLHKLIQQFYYQKNISAVQKIQHAVAQTTKMNHIKVKFLKPNNYSVSSQIITPEHFLIESSNICYGSMQYDDFLNFKRCVQPVINEQALEPAQVSLFQALYNNDFLTRNFSTQFAGQYQQSPLKELQCVLLDLTLQERVYSQTYIVQQKVQANDFMETVYNDSSLSKLQPEEVYNLNQLIDAKKFLNECYQSLLLKNGLICWFENSSMPSTSEQYETFENNFRQNFFWKYFDQKEQITKNLEQINTYGQIPTKDELKDLSDKIDALINDQTLATDNQVLKRNELVKKLREEFTTLKKKVILDNFFSTKAEIQVFSNEIEKLLIKASIKTLDSESQALAKCFTMQVPSIQYHIHPFQQFAATQFDQVNPNSCLDISNKIQSVQILLTKLRNRSTQVETLTSGPGIVVTIKDFNDILVTFCKDIVKFQEKTFKSRTESNFLKEEHYKQLLFVKDQQIKTLENRISNIGLNLENIIEGRLFEKGNLLVYELDSANRILNLFKNAMFGLEQNLIRKIQLEQCEKFKRQTNMIELKTQKFSQYKEAIWNMINADFAEDQEKIKEIIKYKAEQAKNTDKYKLEKPIQMYPCINNNEQISGLARYLNGSVVPKGFEHYSRCSCYKVDPRFPAPTMEQAELEMLSEAEARRELSKLCTLVRQQRILYRTKEMCMQQKYEKKINILSSQTHDNGLLWNQLAESEKRERVLKQELLSTQTSLSYAEKTIMNLKENLKSIDAERSRLINFKSSKVEMLRELEARVKQFELNENIDVQRLIAVLKSKDEQLKEISGIKEVFHQTIEQTEQKRISDLKILKKNILVEQQRTQQVVDKLEQMKIELKLLESNDSSSIWKKKCIDILEICQIMKTENDDLRSRCKDLIAQGIQLAETLGSDYQKQELPSIEQNSISTGNQMYSTSTRLTNNIFSRNTNIRIGQTADSVRIHKSKINVEVQPYPLQAIRKKTVTTQQQNRSLHEELVSPVIIKAQLNHKHLNDIKTVLNSNTKEIIQLKQSIEKQRDFNKTENFNTRKQSGLTQDSIFGQKKHQSVKKDKSKARIIIAEDGQTFSTQKKQIEKSKEFNNINLQKSYQKEEQAPEFDKEI